MAQAPGVVFSGISLLDVVVWQSDCVKVFPGPVDLAAVQKMKDSDYDQAVVAEMVGGEDMAPFESPVGLVSRERLEALASQGSALDLADSAIAKTRIELDGDAGVVSLDRVLDALQSSEATIASWEGYADPGPAPYGLLTRSDLNRHEFRSKLYPILADLETRLARLIRRHLPETWHWLKHLSIPAQVRVLGSWELARRNNKQPDEGPIAFVMLHELLNAAGSSTKIAEAMGDAFRAACAACSWDVDDLRNRVMHVVRPLIIDPGDIGKMKSTLGTVLSLTDQIKKHFP